MLKDRTALDPLFRCLFSADETVRMRAVDGLEKIARKRIDLFDGYRARLLTHVSEINQPSVQWHLVQILPRLVPCVRERARAVAILRRNLESCRDWLVTNMTLEAPAEFAIDDMQLGAISCRSFETTRREIENRLRRALGTFLPNRWPLMSTQRLRDEFREPTRPSRS